MIRQSPILRRLLQISSSKVGARCFTAQASSALRESEPVIRYEEYADVDWNNLGFGLTRTDYMYKAKCTLNSTFEQGQVTDYGNVELSPAAGVLNYGQGIFEGTKAFRGEDGRILLFRPDQNAVRMQIGAERMCMESPSIQQFVDAVKQTAIANKRWIPPSGKGSLYLRPLLIGSGPTLGVSPAPEYTFLVYASPVGNYFKEGTAPLNLCVNTEYHRATRGGAGGVKSITNYAPVIKAMLKAKEQGFSDVLYLDSVHKKYIEEVSSCNIFLVKGNTISTPATVGTILEGITRKSIIDIARDLGYKVEERLVAVDELMEADEVFTTGTAVSVASVGSVTYNGQRVEYKTGDKLVNQKLYKTLVGIQVGKIEDKYNWVVEIK
ncbi:putative branched-chain-amino-acid transaminase [Helianthus annuus]|uniref:Branched-chain-amino-acid aminotransferase n=1 Tax=Helianthus annuus TaxID=4232 RepID=A0A251U6S1_HELAN|nr:branched-chain-amino-acid aminotransferase 2, chloroplastic [Helianthus annuus]KAF5795682.1 putative branched-chain-amino-acid transaminase [Helianthus annuus]KAJ0539148.1 putative branched-chain-amino-acid transaminase [Helianthus annuus]KAJ0553799.1 putative branched-chain-amino-acid transaminase [Helianthus annuus]KAJ0719459.1 putative branched-chain-amino-acid transaminase [Helianthus annuus]KAJ0722686.1 putative branched-chain-amino-acid transaminase [Helianthus annuus]